MEAIETLNRTKQRTNQITINFVNSKIIPLIEKFIEEGEFGRTDMVINLDVHSMNKEFDLACVSYLRELGYDVIGPTRRSFMVSFMKNKSEK